MYFSCFGPFLGLRCDKNAIPAKHFPKKGPSQKSKIGSFPPSTKPHPLNPLTMGPLFLYWLGASQWCSGCCVFAPLLSVFVFFHSRIIYAVTSQFCYILLHVPSAHDYPLWRMTWAFLFGLTLFSSLLGLVGLLSMISCQTSQLGFISFFLSFFSRLLWPICFQFALLLPLIVHVHLLTVISCHAGSLGFISFFLSSLSFYGPFVPKTCQRTTLLI